jgi:hypothetical protein
MRLQIPLTPHHSLFLLSNVFLGLLCHLDSLSCKGSFGLTEEITRWLRRSTHFWRVFYRLL